MKEFSHYQRLICENTRYLYYASSKGDIVRIDKRTNAKYKTTPYFHHGKLCVKINGKDYILATLIAKTFLKEYHRGCCIGYKDGNVENCNVNNLFVYNYSTHGKTTGGLNSKCKAVIVQERGKPAIRYKSVRKAAKALYCSYQTLLDYLEGKSKRSVLCVDGRKIYYASDNKRKEV